MMMMSTSMTFSQGGLETENVGAAEVMPTSCRDEGNPLLCPLLQNPQGGVSKLTIDHPLFISLFYSLS
jgi:hypothetical protein